MHIGSILREHQTIIQVGTSISIRSCKRLSPSGILLLLIGTLGCWASEKTHEEGGHLFGTVPTASFALNYLILLISREFRAVAILPEEQKKLLLCRACTAVSRCSSMKADFGVAWNSVTVHNHVWDGELAVEMLVLSLFSIQKLEILNNDICRYGIWKHFMIQHRPAVSEHNLKQV